MATKDMNDELKKFLLETTAIIKKTRCQIEHPFFGGYYVSISFLFFSSFR